MRRHSSAVMDAEPGFFQALCVCGWSSSVGVYEEVDLLRAIHAHEMSVWGERIQGQEDAL